MDAIHTRDLSKHLSRLSALLRAEGLRLDVIGDVAHEDSFTDMANHLDREADELQELAAVLWDMKTRIRDADPPPGQTSRPASPPPPWPPRPST